MSRIVEDLLMLAKADAGQIVLERKRVAMDSLMRDLFEDAQILGATKGLRIELQRNDPAMVSGDSLRLRQLFRSLLSNAVHYTDENGSIRIASRVDGPSLFTEIEDTGIGIPAESLDRIFERFYRVDVARTRVQGGSGLGLAISKWIAEAHGGTISVHSTPGRGSTFTVRLPLSVDA